MEGAYAVRECMLGTVGRRGLACPCFGVGFGRRSCCGRLVGWEVFFTEFEELSAPSHPPFHSPILSSSPSPITSFTLSPPPVISFLPHISCSPTLASLSKKPFQLSPNSTPSHYPQTLPPLPPPCFSTFPQNSQPLKSTTCRTSRKLFSALNSVSNPQKRCRFCCSSLRGRCPYRCDWRGFDRQRG